MIKRFGFGALVLVLAGLLALGTVAAFARDSLADGARGVVSAFNQDGDGRDGEAANLDGEGKNAAALQIDGEVGQEKIAAALAEEFATGEAQVTALEDQLTDLHDQGIGWGALFQLLAIAEARGITLDALLAEIGFPDEHDFAFGQMREELSEAEQAALADGPKNLGGLVSGTSQGEPEGQAAGLQLGRGHGQGKPEGVPPAGSD